MAVTGTSELSGIVHAAYDKDYLEAWLAKSLWMKFVYWNGDLKQTPGSMVSFPVTERLARVTSALIETSDVTPVAANAGEVSVTMVEYGNAVQSTLKLSETSYPNNGKMIASQVAENCVNSLDYYIRGLVHANTLPIYPAGCTARTDLDATDDIPIYGEVVQLVETARGMEIPPLPDGSYATVIPPAGAYEIRKIAEIVAVSEYSDPAMIYTGMSELKGNEHFPGEICMINNLRVIVHPWGKLYLAAGTAAQAATAVTTAHAISAGDTTVYVDELTGLVAGNYATIGALESSTTQRPTTEQVYISAASGSSGAGTLTVRGAGNAITNWGCKFAHDVGTSVIEAANVFAMPILGEKSVVGYFDSETGKEGRQDMHEHPDVIPGRFWDYSWYWLGGAAIVDKWIVRGEFATGMNILGAP